MNGTLMQFFEWYTSDGGLWKKFKAEAQKLADMGITAVWLPPAYKGIGGRQSVGYDVYDLYDLGEFDQKGSVRTKYGTKKEYIDAVAAGHKHGLQIYIDAVLNHMGGATETEKVQAVQVKEDNRHEYVSEPLEIEAFTKFTFPTRKKKYSDFTWNHHYFTGVDYAKNLDQRGIFKILNGHDGWQDVLSEENGNYDFLMFTDIDFRNEAVRNELKKWIKWYYDTVPFDGLRLDAVKHIPPFFFNEWLDFVHAEINPGLFVVGEYWFSDVNMLLEYIKATEERMSLFDAPLQGRFHTASVKGKDYDLAKIFDQTLVAARPNLAVTLVDNHDTQPCQALEAPVDPWFKPLAYALILLRENGYPCIFYIDIYGAEYDAIDKNGEQCYVKLDKVIELEKLLAVRRENAYGMQRDYFDHPNCIGWTREGKDENGDSGCAVVMSNSAPGEKKMEIGKRHAGKVFIDCLQKHPAEVSIDENGWGTFFCEGGSVSVWVIKK